MLEEKGFSPYSILPNKAKFSLVTDYSCVKTQSNRLLHSPLFLMLVPKNPAAPFAIGRLREWFNCHLLVRLDAPTDSLQFSLSYLLPFSNTFPGNFTPLHKVPIFRAESVLVSHTGFCLFFSHLRVPQFCCSPAWEPNPEPPRENSSYDEVNRDCLPRCTHTLSGKGNQCHLMLGTRT